MLLPFVPIPYGPVAHLHIRNQFPACTEPSYLVS
uniref:Uncharacterized protein n=1 Tax=Arundo donax TaxID=35708 RepID=A0A0A9B4R7_ARUDO